MKGSWRSGREGRRQGIGNASPWLLKWRRLCGRVEGQKLHQRAAAGREALRPPLLPRPEGKAVMCGDPKLQEPLTSGSSNKGHHQPYTTEPRGILIGALGRRRWIATHHSRVYCFQSPLARLFITIFLSTRHCFTVVHIYS